MLDAKSSWEPSDLAAVDGARTNTCTTCDPASYTACDGPGAGAASGKAAPNPFEGSQGTINARPTSSKQVTAKDVASVNNSDKVVASSEKTRATAAELKLQSGVLGLGVYDDDSD